MPQCESCGAEIIWVEMNPSGKRMPLDKKKRLTFRYSPEGNEWKGTWGHESHFASCPFADKHRKGKK